MLKMIVNSEQKKQGTSLEELREYKIVKHNDLIQKSRFSLSSQEQKIILYLISKIMPDDTVLKEYSFEIMEFCQICGIHEDSGANYKYIRNAIKNLADKSAWVMMDDETEVLVRWINRASMSKKSGSIKIRLNDDLKPYLLQLKKRFTAYEIKYTLAMKSQYSIRLYEILKSYEYTHNHEFNIEDLKKRLCAETYARFPDFRRKVLDISMNEISTFSDITVSYKLEKEGRKFAKIIFLVKGKKDFSERLEAWKNIDVVLNKRDT